MGPHGVEVAPPAFERDTRLLERVEDLAVEQLVAQPGIEALDEAVLPRTARPSCSVASSAAMACQPVMPPRPANW
jgi:hypothetical protein